MNALFLLSAFMAGMISVYSEEYSVSPAVVEFWSTSLETAFLLDSHTMTPNFDIVSETLF